MLSLKTTTALIAAISVLATASIASALTTQASIPQAFAQNFTDNDVLAEQSNQVNKEVNQNIGQSQSSGTNDNTDSSTDSSTDDKKRKKDGDTTQIQQASQGFCEQIQQSNSLANAGSVSAPSQTQNDTGTITGGASGGDFSKQSGKDCS
jgi:hypothetical protein